MIFVEIPTRGIEGVPHMYRGVKRNAPFHHMTRGQQKRPRFKAYKPEDFNHFCDTCDKGFKTENKYKEHVAEHQKCHVDGCPYIAAPKLVKLHFNSQHKPGFAKKIWQLESKQDIEKWREERRKNFPTAANIAKKIAAQGQKIERGQVLNNQYFGKMRRKRGQNKYSRGRKQKGCYRPLNNEDKTNSDGNSKDDDVDTLRDRKEDPLSYVLDKNSHESDDDINEDIETNVGNKNITGGLQLAGGLGCLAAAYGSDSGEEEQESAPVPTKPKDNVTVKHQRHPLVKQKQGKNKKGKIPGKQKSTLLQKLLAPDIRHERNVIFQCIRHVVKNNFYGLEKSTTKSDAAEEVMTDKHKESEEESLDRTEIKNEIHDEELWDDAF